MLYENIRKSEKNEVIKLLDNLHWQLEEFELSMRSKIEKLQEYNINIHHFTCDNRRHWFNQIVYYVSNGLTYQQAIQLLCEEEMLDYTRMDKVFESFNLERQTLETAKKVFFCSTLKDKGLSNNKIAELLGCSAVTVAKLLKIKVSKPN